MAFPLCLRPLSLAHRGRRLRDEKGGCCLLEQLMLAHVANHVCRLMKMEIFQDARQMDTETLGGAQTDACGDSNHSFPWPYKFMILNSRSKSSSCGSWLASPPGKRNLHGHGSSLTWSSPNRWHSEIPRQHSGVGLDGQGLYDQFSFGRADLTIDIRISYVRMPRERVRGHSLISGPISSIRICSSGAHRAKWLTITSFAF